MCAQAQLPIYVQCTPVRYWCFPNQEVLIALPPIHFPQQTIKLRVQVTQSNIKNFNSLFSSVLFLPYHKVPFTPNSPAIEMPKGNQQKSNAGVFFLATLILWLISVLYEIGFHGRRELLVVLGGCFFFQFANWVIRNSFSRDPLFVNTSVSLIHSTITSFAVIFILIMRGKVSQDPTQMFEHEQLVGSAWPAAYTALSFSCGYFAYDQWDMLQYHLYSGWFPSILAHHLILLLCFTLALYRNVTINYLILTLICELHSIFLHIRKLRRMLGIRDAKTKIVKAEWVLNWVTFTFARVIPHILITIKLLRDASKFNKGIELPLALFGMVGMNLLNVGLGIDLLAAFKREIKPPMSNHVD